MCKQVLKQDWLIRLTNLIVGERISKEFVGATTFKKLETVMGDVGFSGGIER